jgi:NAD(P)H-dependent flavin oxidoreductase YrpB (nitropropane dioxygenase family)
VTALFADLGIASPVVAAPMAGGPTTPELVVAAARAGSLGFLAGGYKSAEQLAEQIRTARTATEVFGVNLFVPNSVPVDPDAYQQYADLLRAEATDLDVVLPAEPIEDDDHWQDKVDLLVAEPVPVVSLTFGMPDDDVISAWQRAGSRVVQTVTSSDEARQAAAAGVDLLAVQASAAGGHYGTFTPDRLAAPRSLHDLLAEIGKVTDLPLVAAGGLATSEQISAALRHGADAVAVGTVLLRSAEAGTSTTYRMALAGPDRGETVVTRAFTGRPARALRNRFVDTYDAHAPAGYPALHHLTSPMRRAAAAVGDPERINLWAGTGHRHATDEPAGAILERLAG